MLRAKIQLAVAIATRPNLRTTALGVIVKHGILPAIALIAIVWGNACAQSAPNASNWSMLSGVNAIKTRLDTAVDLVGEKLRACFSRPVQQSWNVEFGPTFARTRANDLVDKQTIVGSDWLYLISRKRIRPFLLIGLGGEHDSVSGSGVDSRLGRQSYVTGGFGLQYSVTDRLVAQLDWRRVHGYVDERNLVSNRSNDNYATVSMTYSFGANSRH
jgi:OOP family OmpA-OmpF porin